jgi:hypothetical protein
MAITAGDNQGAITGNPVPVNPEVRVTDQFGNGIDGTSVVFTPSGDGTVQTSPVLTNSTGHASPGTWTLATAPGTNTLTATSPGVSDVQFTAQGSQQTLNIAIVQGNDQNGALSTPLATNPSVLVTDQSNGMPVQGVNVSFVPRTGEGSVNTPIVATDANGNACS